MHPNTEAPPQDPPTDGDRPLLQRVFGHAEPDGHEDQNQAGDTGDGRTADPAQPGDQPYADEQTADQPTAADQRRDGAAWHDEQPNDTVAEPTAGPRDSEPTSLDEPTDLKPGDVAAAAVTAIWAEDSAQDLRDRWREAQLRFVDDPQKAAEDTRNLVNEAVGALTATLASHREQLDSWPANGDTEQYRVVVQRYRTFFEHLLTL